MRLLINTASTYKGGGVQVANSFIDECKKISGNEYHIILGPSLINKIDQSVFPINFSFYYIPHRPATKVFIFQSSKDLKKIEKIVKPDVVFTTSGPAYWRSQAPHLVGYNLPHYIYRDSPFFFLISRMKRIKWYLKGKMIFSFFKRDSDAFVVQTDDVNKRLMFKLKGKYSIFTITNTCSHYFREKHIDKIEKLLPEKEENEFRLLLLSAYYGHKNIEIIPRIIDALPVDDKDKIKFILTIDNESYVRIFRNKHIDNVINIGRVEHEQAPQLYRECDAMFLPTLLECFSASYAEAMYMGKPIVTTDLSFAHGICEDAALYFSPLDHLEAMNKIIELYENNKLYQKLVENGYKQMQNFLTPKQRAEKYLKICSNLCLNRNK